MLKSYKKLDRWYGPLDPEGEGGAADRAAERSEPEVSESEVTAAADDSGPARYPDYIAEAGSASATPDSAPAELSGRRSEFTGGWSDWVDEPAGDRTGDLLHLPWPDDEPAEPARIGRKTPRPDDEAATARRRRTFGVLVAAVLFLAVATAVVVYLLVPGTPQAAGPDDGAGLRFTSGSADAGAHCPDERDGSMVRGAGPGGTESGPAAILRFQHAYYVQRSGAAARDVVAPDAAVSSEEVIQAGIDSVEPGTRHCVQIVAVADGRYSVEVTEYRPGGAPATYSRQTVTTAVIDGRTLITGIRAG